ncbi:hypothetical protein [Rickettsiella massiliensis]|uniref:hypothetical protein n=1 Tax=Rickettsiella massiliensis TaxID=676517 RepID=UPI00178C272C|nr:hypothetical protein [Rickettsiella massiliensis]
MRSRRTRDRRRLTSEAGNAPRRKVICGQNGPSASRMQDESRPNLSRVMRINFGDRMAKIFHELSDSLFGKRPG